MFFCEGHGLKKNPFFNYLSLSANKGELLTIYAPELKVDVLIKSGVFVCPLGGGFYKIGATFSRGDETLKTTKWARKELEKNYKILLQLLIKLSLKVQVFGLLQRIGGLFWGGTLSFLT